MVLAQAKPKVVVIGGGAGGVTAAKYIAKDSAGAIEVTLVEPLQTYQTCFHSNLFLGGFRDYKSITHNYKAVAKHGVKVVHQRATTIDRDKKTVMLANGRKTSLRPAGRLAGHRSEVRFRAGLVAGCGRSDAACLEAGRADAAAEEAAGRRAEWRRDRDDRPAKPVSLPARPLRAGLDDGACAEGGGKDRCKIFVIDPKESFSKQALFQEGWEKHYKAMVEWLGPKVHAGLKSVDPKTGTVVTGFETYKNAALVNVIPAQMAGAIARDAELANDSGYCAIDPASMKSAVDPNIFVLGDACIAGDMPKSAFSANSQAKVAAMVIRGELAARADLPGALHQHLLEPDRDRRLREGRRRAMSRRTARSPRHRRSCRRPGRAPICASKRRPKTWAGMQESRPTCSADRSGMRLQSRRAGQSCAAHL